VDLAGSERAAETNNVGQKLRDGANINKSLLALVGGGLPASLADLHAERPGRTHAQLLRLLMPLPASSGVSGMQPATARCACWVGSALLSQVASRFS